MNKLLFLGAGVFAVLAVVAVFFLQFGMPFSIFQQGAEAPMTVELSGNRFGMDFEEGDKLQLKEGETLVVSLDGSWWNRSLSPYGYDNAGGAWFVDGGFVELIEGDAMSVNQTYVIATNPTVGAFIEDMWDWTTLPILATLPAQGSTVSFQREYSFDTGGLDVGDHQLSVRVFSINGSSTTSIFSDGGVCFPLQTESQGFPCSGIYGSTSRRTKSESSRCPKSTDPYWGTVYTCPSSNWNCGSCLSWCCQSTGSRAICPSPTLVFCDGVGYKNFSDWGDWIVRVERSREETISQNLVNMETVAVLDFEIVKECETECCFEEEGFLNKPCPNNGLCSNGACAVIIEQCPYACCIDEAGYYDRQCPNPTDVCQNNSCISTIPPPPPQDFSLMLISIFAGVVIVAVLFLAVIYTNK